jgi:putative transposase
MLRTLPARPNARPNVFLMPRRARKLLSDGLFHVTARGVAEGATFRDDADRSLFVWQLGEVRERYGWNLIAYCLMGTHYHLLVQTSRKNLSDGMHRLNGLYAQRFNRRHGRKGHLYEERFSAWLLHDEEHLEKTIRYILENPVRAGLCGRVEDWLWSWASNRSLA